MYFNRKNAEQKNWRMIKKGKHFLFGCSLVFAVGATLATPAVHADSVEAKAETTTSAAQAEPTTEAPTYAAPAATSPVATEAVEANSATTVVSADKSQLEAVLAQAKAKNLDGQEASVKAEVAAAIAEAEALVANGSASQEQVNQSVERLTQAVASVKEVTEATVETTTEAASEETTDSSETPKVRNKRATSEGTSRAVDESRLDRVTVTKDNFDSFFKEGGNASYDETSGTIKLTDDVGGQVGSAYLRFKIDPKEDFTFTGKVDIGDKYEGHPKFDKNNNNKELPGGDGVGFVFHTGNVDTIGQSGASIGMGTIKNAFGFKLDSWHNTNPPKASDNAPMDPKYGGNAWRSNAFGAFYSSNAAGRVTTVGDAKALNPNPNGQWVDFKIEYKGQSKEFIVTYGYEKWSTNLKTANASVMAPNAKTALNNSNATYALSFLGSTGSGTNLQRVQIEKFEFTAPQIVQVAFYDEAGNELAASSAIPGDRDQVVNLSNIEAVQKAITKIKAKGYTLKEVNSDKAETYNSGANTVTLRSGGQLLKYVFAVPSPAVTPTLQATGSMTVAGVKSTDNTLSGTGVPGATVTVKVAGVTLADNITVGTDGTWTTTLSKGFNSNITNQDQLVPKDSVTITQKIGVSESEATEVAVGLGESTVQPSTDSKDQQSIVAETTTVTLKVPHDAGITYFDYPNANNGRSEVAIKRDSIPGAWTSKDESKAVVTSYSSDGFFDTIVLEMKEKIQPGKAKVISNIKETNYSSPVDWKEINVEAKPDTTPPVAPTVNPVKAGATAITGTAEADSTVEVTLPNGQKASAKAGDNGEFSITVPALSVDDQIRVTATDAANNTSDATTVTVKENVRPVVTIPYDDKANQIIYLYSGEENNIELKITDNSGKISKAYLVFAQDNRTGLGTEDAGYLNGKTKSALYLKANRFGSETTATEANPAIIKLTANIPNGSYTDGTGMTRYIYAEDLAGNTNYDNVGAAGDTGAPGRIRFVWKPQTFKYNAQAPSTPITSSTLPEASAIEKAVKDANPTFSDKIGSVTLDGTNVKVTYKDGSTDVIPANSVFTIEPTAPTVTPVKNPSSLEQPEKDAVKKAVETANPSATKVEVGTDGTTTLTYSNGSTAKLTPAQTVSQADVTPPVAPTVNAVKAGATSITGTAEEGSTVEVTLPNGQKASAKAGDNGVFSITVPALNADDQISVTATDAANNTSTPTKVTVKETVRPVLNIPYDDAENQVIYVYSGEENNIELKITDNSGKISKAYLVFAQDNRTGLGTEDTGYLNGKTKSALYLKANRFGSETTATETNPAIIKLTANIPNGSYTDGTGMTRYLFAEDAAGNTSYEHVGANMDKGALGRIRFVWKPQTFKYTAVAPSTPITSNTVPEASAIEKAVKDANPTFSDKIGSVTLDGTNVKVTYKDGSTDTLSADSVFTIKPTAPTVTPVKNTSALTTPEKQAVEAAVRTKNPDATTVVVGNDGSTTLTYSNGSTAKLTPAQTVKAADANGVQEPAAKTPVQNTSALTQPEKDAVKKAVEDANPTATKVEVGNDGSATVTFPDGTTATLTGDKTVKEADSKGVQEPA
ncbi:Ig-like domain-containing protein, partial [Streptococcus sp. SO4]|uniref:lectin-like domain-containing protein n=1 Tax=Streptococcus sp. SO4 TaxID=3018249 RepID=UPI00263DEA16